MMVYIKINNFEFNWITANHYINSDPVRIIGSLEILNDCSILTGN